MLTEPAHSQHGGDPGGPRRLLDYEDAATYLACSVENVRNLIRAGELRPVRIGARGGAPRLDIRDLDDYVDSLSRPIVDLDRRRRILSGPDSRPTRAR